MKKVRLFAVAAAMGMFASTVAAAEPVVSTGYTTTWGEVDEIIKVDVGDKVVARLVLTLDRAMDFVQLKESDGACLEPDKNLSGYRWNGEMGYYVDVKDATTNFFFDHLDKGVYVLEQAYRVSRVGTYQVGPATLLCAYAPEFVAVSSGSSLEITPTEK